MFLSKAVCFRLRRSAALASILLSLVCLLAPSHVINRVDILGLGKNLGLGNAAAADVTPVTVDNSTSGMAVQCSTQRKVFHAAGRFWIFYSDGTDLVYRSSSDGLSWSAKSGSLGPMTAGDGFSVHFDGTYVHYARTTSTNSEPLYYRRGVPGGDGTIAWNADEQIAAEGVSAARYLYPSVSVDSSGHALISYHFEKQNAHAGEGPYVTKSGNPDGTWGATPAGFPYELAADSESEWYTTVHGLTSDRIAVAYADHTNVRGVSIATCNGTSWNSAVTTVSDPQFGGAFSTVAQGDDVDMVLLKTVTYDIVYCRYAYSTNTLGSEYTLMSSAAASSMPSLARDSNNGLYCFWLGAPAASHIYYTRMISGVWDAGYTDWLTEPSLYSSGGLSAFYDQGGSDSIGVAWEAGTASPYDIRFAAVSTAPAPNQAPGQPGNVLPANGAPGQSLTPTLESSAFSDPDVGDTHGASQWQITAVAGNYSSPVYDSLRDNVNLLTIPVPSGTLGYSTTYYWHVRHQDNHGDWSEWSVETSFSTLSAPNQLPGRPGNVSPANGAPGQSLTPTLECSTFSDPDAGDSHAASQWQVTAVAGDYSSAVFDSLTDDVNLLSMLVPSGKLGYSTTYYWHVRHQDNHGDWSEWSVETSFSTLSAPNQAPGRPGNVSPANGAPGQSLTPTLESSAFSDPDVGDTHGASQWQITGVAGNYSSPVYDSLTDDVNLLTIPVPSGTLGYSTTYYWHVRHQDNHGNWSEWSTESSISTAAASQPPEEMPTEPVNALPCQPGNSLPIDAATDRNLTPTLESSTFSDPDAGDSHAASQWQITVAAGNYASPVFDSLMDNVNLLSIPVPSGTLGYSTTYYWHVRHQDNHGDWSEWSVETSFATISAPGTPPEEIDGGDVVPAPSGVDNGQSPLAFLLSIAIGVVAVVVVSSALFAGYRVRVSLENRPKGLSSARTISKRLRK